jgi:hypothetical protein
MVTLSDILAALPQMNQGDLGVVKSTVDEIIRRNAQGKQNNSVSRTSGSRRDNHGKKSKTGPKGPAQKTSTYAGEPAYNAFKAAQSGLKEFLRREKLSLKQLEAKPLADHPPILAGFYEARQWWFHRKAELTTETPAEAEAQSAEAEPEGKTGKAL